MRFLLSLVLCLGFLGFAVAEEKKLIDIFMQQQIQKDGTTKFYMWIKDRDWIAENTAPDISVGASFSSGYAYLESENITNAMFSVHPYTKNRGYPGYTIIKFGGYRDNDINIYLPEGAKAKVHISTIEYKGN